MTAPAHRIPELGLDAAPACTDPRLEYLGLDWFSTDPSIRLACAAVCAACPLRGPCFAGAARRGETHGIWGGHPFDGLPITGNRRRLTESGQHRWTAAEDAALMDNHGPLTAVAARLGRSYGATHNRLRRLRAQADANA